MHPLPFSAAGMGGGGLKFLKQGGAFDRTSILGVHRKIVGCCGVGECHKKTNIEWVIAYKGEGSGLGYFEDVR